MGMGEGWIVRGQACPAWSDPPRTNDRVEAGNTAVREGAKQCRHRAPRRSDLEQWHRVLFDGFTPPGHEYYAGNTRQPSCEAPCLEMNVEVGGVPGTHFSLVNEALLHWERETRLRIKALQKDWKSLGPEDRLVGVCTAISHAVGAFIRIHPFVNGNGRTSRVLFNVLMARFELSSRYSVVGRPAPPYSELMRAAMHRDDGPLIAALVDNFRELGESPRIRAHSGL